jgi:hypothetical protein
MGVHGGELCMDGMSMIDAAAQARLREFAAEHGAGRTHWKTCAAHGDHIGCLVLRVLDALDAAERERDAWQEAAYRAREQRDIENTRVGALIAVVSLYECCATCSAHKPPLLAALRALRLDRGGLED